MLIEGLFSRYKKTSKLEQRKCSIEGQIEKNSYWSPNELIVIQEKPDRLEEILGEKPDKLLKLQAHLESSRI